MQKYKYELRPEIKIVQGHMPAYLLKIVFEMTIMTVLTMHIKMSPAEQKH